MIRRAGMVVWMSCWLAVSAAAQTADPDLSATSLESLTQMRVSVSSFARKDEDLWKTPAAVFVISREDIERSSVSSVPELLRLVPGMQVAQLGASNWAISARGFNSAYAYKLLVLIDGRTVYSEIYSGAHWDQIDLPLDTIERIEVVRGPGAAVWGTNAVNGVVNIITRRARNTVGVEAAARIGRINRMTTLQYGGSSGDRFQYRGYANYTDRQPFETAAGGHAFDGEDSVRAGMRADWQRTKADWITLGGDIYGGHLKQQLRDEFDLPVGPDGHDSGSIAGGYLLGRWEHKLTRSNTALQLYFDDTSRHELGDYSRTRTFDADFQDHQAVGPRNDLVWGGEFRLTQDRSIGQPQLIKKPNYLNYLVDGFGQDEFTLVPDRLVLTIGSKFQQGTLAGFQVQPSVRALWSPDDTQSFWGAVSRAVVSPSVQDIAIQIPLNLGTEDGLPVSGILTGNPDFKPETVLAYELGYRRRFGSRLTVDVAGFFNAYHRVQSLAIEAPVFVPAPTPHIDLQLEYTNGYRAKTAGVEGALSWKPQDKLTLGVSYAWMQAHTAPSQPGNQSLADSWSTARNTLAASGAWSFYPKWNFSTFLNYVESLPPDLSFNLDPGSTKRVPSLVRLDAQLVRKAGRHVEFAAGGTNLLSPRHVEFGGGTAAIVPAYVPRNLFVRAKWTF